MSLPYRLAALGCVSIVASVAGFVVLDRCCPFPLRALQRPPALVVTDRNGEPLRAFLPADRQWRIPVRLDEVAPEMIHALIVSEDRWFGWHPGVNPVAIVRAAWTNARCGRVVSGGSTIPMQVARLADPRARTIGAKLREAFRAVQLTLHHSKSEVLELYLNRTPYGGNIEGVGAAAYFYFGKTAAQLSLGEAALLTTLPRAPRAYDPSRDPIRARAARDRVLAQLLERRAFPAAAIADALRQPVPNARRRAPFVAPHFTQLMADRGRGSGRVATMLDQRVQGVVEQQSVLHLRRLQALGIEQAAVVVIENRSRALRALVGSADFFAGDTSGQVNAAIAPRSPGSTLKPFLYAMAFDAGRIIPDSYLLDVPTDFSGYTPENYDGQFRGRVTAREALVNSLNAPAVRLLADVGLEGFHDLLRRGGLSSLDRPSASYGLPLILGDGEVTLLDLTNLYTTLAAGGLHRPVQLQPGPLPPGERLLSPEAAHLVTEILLRVRRPDLPHAWDLTRRQPAVAWKTGTSYGHRDAWAIGYSDHFTIGVWVGNMDGHGQKGLAGAEHAAPLLFDIFAALEHDAAAPKAAPGLRIETIEVCALSHELPGPNCTERVTVPYIAGRSKLATCHYHQRMFVDRETREQLTGDCLRRRPYEPVVATVYPTELVAWWRTQGLPIPFVPHLSSACLDIPRGEAPRITSPSLDTVYGVRRSAPLDYQRIVLIAQVPASVDRLFWYHDGALIHRGAPAEPAFLSPQPGMHRLTVVDDAGRSDTITYRVE